MRLLEICALAGVLATFGCSEPANEPMAACYSGTDSVAMCVEQSLEAPDDRAYIMSTCGTVNGQMRDRCPSDNLVGVCARRSDVPTGSGYAARDTRTFHYRHQSLADERAVAAIGKRCGAESWSTAEQWLATH